MCLAHGAGLHLPGEQQMSEIAALPPGTSGRGCGFGVHKWRWAAGWARWYHFTVCAAVAGVCAVVWDGLKPTLTVHQPAVAPKGEIWLFSCPFLAKFDLAAHRFQGRIWNAVSEWLLCTYHVV